MALTGPDDNAPPENSPHRRRGSDLFAPRAMLQSPAVGRHSRVVRALRIALPVLAALLLAVMIGWQRLLPILDAWQQPDLEDSTMAGETAPQTALQAQQDVAAPRFMGIGNDNLPYSVTADRARQSQDGRGVIVLEKPTAEMTLRDGHWLALEAAEGAFNREAQTLSLTGGVQLFHDAGYSLTTDQVDIALGEQTATAITPAEGHGPAGAMRAQGFTLDIRAGTLHLQGQSTLIVRSIP
jgi:lipopolysaccharide export system protein LptC